MARYCESCHSEYEGEHRCYKEVDVPYFNSTVLDEFFIRCGLCFVQVGLRALLDGGWKRMEVKEKPIFHKGYICPACAKKLGV